MSITATLIAFASGLAAKVNIASDQEKKTEVEVERLLKRIGKLECQLCAAENARDAAEVRVEHLLAGIAQERRWQEHVAHAQLMNAQLNAQMAQQAQLAAVGLSQQQQQLGQQNFQQLGQVAQQALLGAQNLDSAHWREWVCTCIPDRASALRRR